MKRAEDDGPDAAAERLPRPRATLLVADGGVVATRVHYETLNDAMFLLRATALAAVVCLAAVVVLSLATANVDLRLGMMAVAAYPRLLFSSVVWTSSSVFSAILVAWFVVFCVFCHIVRLHFNTTDPPREWDDRNGEWSVVELDVRPRPKPSGHVRPAAALAPDSDDDSSTGNNIVTFALGPSSSSSSSSSASTCGAAEASAPLDQWQLCVLPASRLRAGAMRAEIALLTPDRDYLAWRASQKQ
ncbi:hypothetical protein H4R18_004444 [Coemansia javaensis]|uniref:Uncharacterized protein n=1 Tax=Coemansia javaensis TaxID=2761396 RepID=A0A9W8H7Q7_9FUNG|nr:hypothetical protein H4R18_004444 [Coemansia javaensis]